MAYESKRLPTPDLDLGGKKYVINELRKTKQETKSPKIVYIGAKALCFSFQYKESQFKCAVYEKKRTLCIMIVVKHTADDFKPNSKNHKVENAVMTVVYRVRASHSHTADLEFSF